MFEAKLSQAPEEIKENPSIVSITTTNNLEIRQVDRAIDNTHKVKYTCTQCRPKLSTPLLVNVQQ